MLKNKKIKRFVVDANHLVILYGGSNYSKISGNIILGFLIHNNWELKKQQRNIQ